MKYIKKNKWTIIAIIVLIILVFVGMQVKNLLVPDEGKASYGDRLDSVKDHKLKDELFKDIETKLTENEAVTKVEYKVHGKIINLIITVGNDTSIDDSKKIGSSTISMFENDELSFYSLQVYIKKDDASLNNFPIIGYKGTQSNELSWTKDREIVSEDNDEK